MTMSHEPVEAQQARIARIRRDLSELDYSRNLQRLSLGGNSQTQIANWLGISQPSVSSALRNAEKVAMPPEGFSGVTPEEIIQRYAVGLINKTQLIDELVNYPYAKAPPTDGHDSLTVDPRGTWDEVGDAVRRGLIDDDIYELVFNIRHELEGALEQLTVESSKPDQEHDDHQVDTARPERACIFITYDSAKEPYRHVIVPVDLGIKDSWIMQTPTGLLEYLRSKTSRVEGKFFHVDDYMGKLPGTTITNDLRSK